MDLARSSLLRAESGDARRVRLARDRVHTGKEVDLASVRPVILDSWRRSRQAGVDPRLKAAPMVVSSPAAEDAGARVLCAAAEPVLRLLGQALGDGSFLLLLNGSRCQTLGVFGTAGMLREGGRINAVAGSEWSEERVGTDAAALSMLLGQPMQVHWFENYAAVGDRWTGNAAPVRDPALGEVLGTVSLYGYGCIAHPQALELAVRAASMAEERLAEDEQRHRLNVFAHYGRHLSRYPDDPAICLDRQGRVLALSSAAVALLGVRVEEAAGRTLSALPGIALDEREERLAPAATRRDLTLRRGDRRISAVLAPIEQEGQLAGYLLQLERAKRARADAAVRVTAWRAAHRLSDVIGTSAAIEAVRASARIAAERDCTVLLVGESGTGKELFAHAIHAESRRAAGPFVPLNCGGLGDELLSSELFGYEDGAFTGAARGGRIGKLELADRGTLFLDEIEAMSPRMQVALLRFLEEKRVLRVGGDRPRSVDVRIVAATNVDLRQGPAREHFREDLFYRLSVFPIELPPLRVRSGDLPRLAEHLLREEGLAKALAPEALERLARHDWPGNVRELRNTLLQAALRTPGGVICAATLALPAETGRTVAEESAAGRGLALRLGERRTILEALQRHGGSIGDAARDLGIHRVTLYRKLKRHSIRTRREYRPE